MQYPIIDNLSYAYQRNGWTGLEITESKNIFDIKSFLDSRGATYTIEDSVYYLTSAGDIYQTPLVLSETPQTFTLSAEFIRNITTIRFRIELLNENNIVSAAITNEILVSTGVGIKIRFNWSNGGDAEFKNIQIEKGPQATPYEPYAPPTTDIANRLKLPLPHYFPHPVIDALQRAAAGSQTADDTEVLRHYLTPLGIGGI